MTVERRIVVSLGDIRAVIFQCKTCATRVAVPPDKLDEVRSYVAQWNPGKRRSKQKQA